MKTYTARLEQEHDGRWSVELEEEPRVHTWGKTIDQALTRMREAAALWYQTDEALIELVPRPVLPKATGRTVEQARKAREQARKPTAWPSSRPAKQLSLSPAAGSACATPPRSSASPTSVFISCSCKTHPHAAKPAEPALRFTEPKQPGKAPPPFTLQFPHFRSEFRRADGGWCAWRHLCPQGLSPHPIVRARRGTRYAPRSIEQRLGGAGSGAFARSGTGRAARLPARLTGGLAEHDPSFGVRQEPFGQLLLLGAVLASRLQV